MWTLELTAYVVFDTVRESGIITQPLHEKRGRVPLIMPAY